MKPGKQLAARFLPTLLCLVSMLVVACGGGGGTTSPTNTTGQKAPDDKQIYIRPYAGLSDIKTLDPALTTDLYSAQAQVMVYTSVVEYDDQGKLIDVLAASHKVSSDGLTYSFTLRDNAKFSDGKPVTSEDVVFSLDRSLQPATKSAYGPYYLSLIKGSEELQAGKVKTLIGTSLRAPDPRTVEITISKPAAYFLYALTHPVAYVIQKSLVEQYKGDFTKHLDNGGGSGPWIVSKYERGKEIVFTPNQYYFGKKPQLKKIVRPFYKEGDTAYRDYQAGRVHSSGVPTPNIDQAKALPDGQYRTEPQLGNIYFAMNYLVKPFNNIKIRQAFALALDKDVIAQRVYKGTVIPTNHIILEGMPGYNPDLVGPGGVKSTKGDAEMAKKLLAEGMQEEGYKSVKDLPPIVFEVSSGGLADVRNEYAVEQQMWKNVLGIDVKFSDVDFNKLSDDTTATTGNNSLAAWWIGWIADYPDPQNWTSVQFGKGAGNNNVNYGQNQSKNASQQQEVQKLLDQADANSNNDERMKQYQQAEQQLVNDVAWIPVYQQLTVGVRKPCVVGIVPNAFNITPPDDWGSIYISNHSTCADVSRYQ
jgi:oligopeptide transport system substrate-binding protein